MVYSHTEKEVVASILISPSEVLATARKEIEPIVQTSAFVFINPQTKIQLGS